MGCDYVAGLCPFFLEKQMNTRSLDQLHQFAAFIEFLSNPAEHKKLLADLQKATVEYNKAVESMREGKDFQSWRNETFDKIKSKEDSLAETLADMTAKNDQREAFLNDLNEKLAAREAKIVQAEAEVASKLEALANVKREQDDLTKAKEAFYARQEKFNAQVAEFEQKAAAVKALMGGK